jgi:hypothetical protein
LAIQPENKIFPHIQPPLPRETGNIRDDVKELFRWIGDQQKGFEDLIRQIVDKYNLHVDGTHAHPKAWQKWKVPRQKYYVRSAPGTVITVPASTTVPALFVVDGELFEIYSDLTCDLATGGAGGLDTHPGTAIAINTPYYLYGIRNSDTVALIASANSPTTASADGTGNGPEGYEKWTYVGSAATRTAAANFREFEANNGFVMHGADIERQSENTTAGAYVAKVFPSIPLTANKVYMGLWAAPTAGVGAGDTTYIGGNGSNYTFLTRVQVNGTTMFDYGWVEIETAQTVYVYTTNTRTTAWLLLVGWMEDPTEYP